MIRINLLPHRAEKRRAKQLQFIILGSLSFVVGAILVVVVHFAISAQIDYQGRRNEYLNQEIKVLDKQIEEIKKLREQTQSLLARKNVVENLQATRSDVVHLLDQMLRILPEGVHLRSIKQSGYKIALVGYAREYSSAWLVVQAKCTEQGKNGITGVHHTENPEGHIGRELTRIQQAQRARLRPGFLLGWGA